MQWGMDASPRSSYITVLNIPASSEEPLRGFLNLKKAVHFVPFDTALRSRLPLIALCGCICRGMTVLFCAAEDVLGVITVLHTGWLNMVASLWALGSLIAATIYCSSNVQNLDLRPTHARD